MKNKLRKYTIVAAGSLMLVGAMAGTSLAWGPHHNNGYNGHGYNNGYNMGYKCGNFYGPRGGQFDAYLVDKGVPADTVNAYIADKNKFWAENEAAFEAMRAKGLELYEEMRKPAPNADKAKALQGELSKMRVDLDASHMNHQLHVKQAYPQICELMQQKFQDKGFGPGPGYNGKPGPGFHHNGPGPQR